jgi:hypothetical protein
VVTLENDITCTLAANVRAPGGMAIGKDATLTYATANNGNTCSAISVR